MPLSGQPFFIPTATIVPVWACFSGAAPVVGNGTLTGKAGLINGFIQASFTLTGGTTTTFGGGVWFFTLPAPFNAVATAKGLGRVSVIDSGGTELFGDVLINPASGVIIPSYAGAAVTATAPFTWGSTDVMSLVIGFPVT
jgi:hypothetical protein